jgi:hypothetical protein
MTKYFFSFPFNPKNEVEFLKTDLNEIDDYKEQALTLFFVFTGLALGKWLLLDWLGGRTTEIESLVRTYFFLAAKLCLYTIIIKKSGKFVYESIDNYKLFSVIIVSLGLTTIILSSLVDYVLDYLNFYSMFLFYFIDLIYAVVFGLLLFFGLSATKEFSMTNNDLSENMNTYLLLVAMVFVVGFVFNRIQIFTYMY